MLAQAHTHTRGRTLTILPLHSDFSLYFHGFFVRFCWIPSKQQCPRPRLWHGRRCSLSFLLDCFASARLRLLLGTSHFSRSHCVNETKQHLHLLFASLFCWIVFSVFSKTIIIISSIWTVLFQTSVSFHSIIFWAYAEPKKMQKKETARDDKMTSEWK